MRLLGMVLIGATVGAVTGSLAAAAVVAAKGYWYLTALSAVGGAIVGGVGGTIMFSKPSCAA